MADAELIDRVLHARAEVLLWAALRREHGRIADPGELPLVLVGRDRARAVRWVRDADPGLYAAVASEVHPVAAGALVVDHVDARGLSGTAVTVSDGGSRAIAVEVRARSWWPGRARVSLGEVTDPDGAAQDVARALERVMLAPG